MDESMSKYGDICQLELEILFNPMQNRILVQDCEYKYK